MAEQGTYPLKLVIDIPGAGKAKGELRALNKFIDSLQKRNKLRFKLEVPMEPLHRLENKLRNLRSSTWEVIVGVRDLATSALEGITGMADALKYSEISLPVSVADHTSFQEFDKSVSNAAKKVTEITENGLIPFKDALDQLLGSMQPQTNSGSSSADFLRDVGANAVGEILAHTIISGFFSGKRKRAAGKAGTVGFGGLGGTKGSIPRNNKAGGIGWLRRLFGDKSGQMPTDSPKAIFSDNYQPAGKRFWKNIPLDRVHRRDEIVRLANEGKLKRYNDLEKAFGGPVATKSKKFKFFSGSNKLGFMNSGIFDLPELPVAGSKMLKVASRAFRPLSTVMDIWNIASAESGEERMRAIGGAAGGWGGFAAGAAAGAAIGSVIPGIGTAVGALIGGTIGGLGGSAVGEWLGGQFEHVKNTAQKTWDGIKRMAGDTWNWISNTAPQSIGRGIGSAVGYIDSTLFNGQWWGERWSAVQNVAASSWETAKNIWNNAVNAIGETIFNGEWWKDRWNGAKAVAKDAWEHATELWSGVRDTIENTVFSSDWWGNKWKSIKDWASNFFGKDNASGYSTVGWHPGKPASNGKAYAYGGFVTLPHFALVGEAGPEAIIPLSSRFRSRALALWQATGRKLGVQQMGPGGDSVSIALAGAGMNAPVVNLHFDLSGLVGQITVQARDDLEETADRVAAVIARKLKSIFSNLES